MRKTALNIYYGNRVLDKMKNKVSRYFLKVFLLCYIKFRTLLLN